MIQSPKAPYLAAGDCVRKAGRPVGWATPNDFWNELGKIKIKFEQTRW